MPIITLPNGDQKSFDQAVSVMQVAQSIGPGLAKNTVAVSYTHLTLPTN